MKIFYGKKKVLIIIFVLLIASIPTFTVLKKVLNNRSCEFLSSCKYPIDDGVTLTYWLENPMHTSTFSMAETEFCKELEKETGINVKFIHPDNGNTDELFNLMAAADDWPDIVEYPWRRKGGLAQRFIDSGVITILNDYMDEYSPNFKEYLKDNPDIESEIITEDGKYFCYPFIRNDISLLICQGPILRKDWLNELSLPEPETIDDWTNVLRRFRDDKNCSAPFSINKVRVNYLFRLLGATTDFYLDNNTVTYGPLTPEFENALNVMKNWYSESLLEPNIETIDANTVTASILSGRSGATISAGGNAMGNWLSEMKSDPSFDLTGVKYAKNSNGIAGRFAIFDSKTSDYGMAIITHKCKRPDAAALLLDYGYSKKGSMLYNFGVKKKSYNMVKGYPTYTDAVRDSNKYVINSKLVNYARSIDVGPFVQDKRYLEQYYGTKQQKKALENWMTSYDIAIPTLMPKMVINEDISNQIYAVMQQIEKYVQGYYMAVITGKTSIDTYNEFTATLKEMGIDSAASMYQQTINSRTTAKQ